MPFAHEKLDVYNLALDFLDSVGKAVLERVGAMLVKLAKAHEG